MTQDPTHATDSVAPKSFIRNQGELFLVLFIVLFAIIGLATCFGLSTEVAYISAQIVT